MITKTINASGEAKEYDYGDKFSRIDRGPDLRRTGDKKKKGYQISEMWDSHHEIARLLILGEKGTDIAKKLNCSVGLVSNVRNSPVVKDKMAVMRAARDAGTIELSREIRDLAPIAIQRLKEALTEGTILGKELSASAIAKEANNIIDREQGKAIQRVDSRNIHGHFTMSDIDRIKEKAKKLAGETGQMACDI